MPQDLLTLNLMRLVQDLSTTDQTPLFASRNLLSLLGSQLSVQHPERIPQSTAVVVVSNHRSFMDAPLLMAALNRPIRFACHHYMGQVPVMREIVARLGCFPLDASGQRQSSFFSQASELLQARQMVGIFPEGTQPMVSQTQPDAVGEFHRGFAHLALRAPVEQLAVLPVAIASQQETTNSVVPLRLLRWFDPSEPLFDQEGWHPMVMYQAAEVRVGEPIWIQPQQRQLYHSKQARTVVAELIDRCQTAIHRLL